VARAGDQACVVDGRPGRACIEQQGAWDSRVQVSLLIDALTRCFCIPRERRRVRLSARHGHENSTSDQAGAPSTAATPTAAAAAVAAARPAAAMGRVTEKALRPRQYVFEGVARERRPAFARRLRPQTLAQPRAHSRAPGRR
jgi:hypothetical protein